VSPPVRVTVAHLRAVPGFSTRPGLCMRGSREWFALHGLDWSAFVREGIDADVLDATGDALGLHVAAFARQQARHGR